MPYQKSPEICPVCQKEADFKFIQDYENEGKEWSLYQCSKCQIQFWIPFENPGAKQYGEVADYTDKISILRKEYCWLIFDNYWYMTQFLKHLPHTNPEGKKLLDLGCGGGEFLWIMQNLGYQVYGVDFNENAINFAKNYLGINKNIYKEDVISFLEGKKEGYDVITAFEIVEHLDNPKRLIELVYQALKPGGYFVASVPNRKRFFGKITPPEDYPWRHLTRWDTSSLNSLIKIYPFEIMAVKKQIPTDWLIGRLWILIKFIFQSVKRIKLSKVENKYSSIEPIERIQKTIGLKRYKFIKSAIKFLLYLPALFLFYVFKFEGSEMYFLVKKKY